MGAGWQQASMSRVLDEESPEHSENPKSLMTRTTFAGLDVVAKVCPRRSGWFGGEVFDTADPDSAGGEELAQGEARGAFGPALIADSLDEQ